MEAKDSRGGSYAWRSILKGRDVIQRGSRWRVGDGKSINIWQHRWIPRKNSSLVASYPIESMENCSVAVLIEENERRWNEELIDGIFSPEEAALIKKIPLSRRVAEDVLVWPYTQDGHYTCKTGYRFLKEEAEEDSVQLDLGTDTRRWKGIWSLQIPNKVKNLLWRAYRGALPTKEALVRRTIIEDLLCDRCHETQESPLHALWLCNELDTV